MDVSDLVSRDRPPQTSAQHWPPRAAERVKVVEERGNASGWTSEQGKLSGVGGGGITGPSQGWKVGCHPVPHPYLFFPPLSFPFFFFVVVFFSLSFVSFLFSPLFPPSFSLSQ